MSELVFEINQSAGTEISVRLENTSIPLIWCPAGDFYFKTNKNHPDVNAHKITFEQGFWMGQMPITQNIWKAVKGRMFRCIDEPENGKTPVEGLSWHEAVRFGELLTNKLRLSNVLSDRQIIRLPTESQWEYACRAGTETRWFFGNDEKLLEDFAWFQRNSNNTLHEAGLKKTNQWGIYDLYGNVSEWCLEDFYKYKKTIGSLSELQDLSGIKPVRGGNFESRAEECTSTSKRLILKDNPFVEETGFRIVVCADLE